MTSYDALGRQVSATDSRTGTSWTHYNAKGQVDWVMDAASNKTWFGYDPASGLRVAVTNAALEVTRTAYDLRGNVTNATGATYPVGYGYDAWGRMASLTTFRSENGQGDTTRWQYDLATGLLTNKVYADGKGPVYAYDAAGQLTGRTWARGVTTAYRYAFNGALTNIDYSDATPDVVLEYDRMGRQTRAIAVGIATNVFTYNPTVLAMTNETVSTRFEAGTRRIRRFYGMNDRPTELGLGSDYVVRYGYGTWGRQDELTFGVGPATSKVAYAYVKNSELLQSRVPTNGPAFRPAYEPARDLISWVTNRFGGTVISRFAYENDAVGRRTKRVDSGAVTNVFGYNGRSELIEALMGADRYSYRFDPIGNRIVATNIGEAFGYTANALNQYTSVVDGGTVVPAYDDDGNMVSLGVWTYVWDAENRLAVATDGSVSVTNVYDFMSRRIAKATATGARSFLYDGWNPIREVAVASGTLSTNFYVWGPDLSGTLQGAGGVGGLIAVIRDGTPYFAAYDANGNVTEYVAQNGTVVAHYEYDPFGNTTAATGPMAEVFAHRFSTKYWDAETELYYYGRRFYRPVLGRWVSRDPIEEEGGLNLHMFCGNGPASKTDPFGLESYCCCRGKIVSGMKISCGVIINRYRGPDPRVHGREQFVHYWISWPGGSADANADFDDKVHSPAHGPKYWKRTGFDPPELVSLCEVDLVALWNCLGGEADKLLRGNKKFGTNDCKRFAEERMLRHCIKKSKGCTTPDEAREYLAKVPRSLF